MSKLDQTIAINNKNEYSSIMEFNTFINEFIKNLKCGYENDVIYNFLESYTYSYNETFNKDIDRNKMNFTISKTENIGGYPYVKFDSGDEHFDNTINDNQEVLTEHFDIHLDNTFDK